MTPEEEGFWQAILDAPNDDVPRRIYADWLEEQGQSERSELIRVQCGLGQGEPVKGREEELEKHFARLVGSKHLRLQFYGGLLWHVTAIGEPGLRAVIANAEKLASLGPLRELVLAQPSGSPAQPVPRKPCRLIGDLTRLPVLSYVETLSLSNPIPGTLYFDAEAAEAVAGSPYLLRLATLDLSGNIIGARGVRALIESPNLPALHGLDLSGTRWIDYNSPDRPQIELANVGSTGARVLADSLSSRRLRELGLAFNGLTRDDLAALLRSPYLQQLTELNLTGNGRGPDDVEVAQAMARPPRAWIRY